MSDMVLKLEAPLSLTLSENRNLRFVTLFLLYFAQGLPFGLIDFALPAWLAQVLSGQVAPRCSHPETSSHRTDNTNRTNCWLV